MLMKNERLASLRTSFDQTAHRLTIETVARQQKISADLRTTEGRAVIERFFADYCAGELRGAPRVLHADGHSFSDLARKVVSIINLASVATVEDMVGAPVNPLRDQEAIPCSLRVPWKASLKISPAAGQAMSALRARSSRLEPPSRRHHEPL